MEPAYIQEPRYVFPEKQEFSRRWMEEVSEIDPYLAEKSVRTAVIWLAGKEMDDFTHIPPHVWDTYCAYLQRSVVPTMQLAMMTPLFREHALAGMQAALERIATKKA